MHAEDVLYYGHQTVLNAINGIPTYEWASSKVTGVWSLEDVIAHLTSHEQVFVDVLRSLISDVPTPILEQFKKDPGLFNDAEVERRREHNREKVISEYMGAYSISIQLISQVPLERRRLRGILPWYGEEYDLEDYIAYGVYGHKREHSAQINAYKERLSKVSISQDQKDSNQNVE
jgi:hypothetical protein